MGEAPFAVMNKRLVMLEQLTATPAADAFAWYGLAMEYRKEERLDDAVLAFQTLRSKFPDYLAQYLMAGQTLMHADRPSEAIPWLERGIEIAQLQGNAKALSELNAALQEARDLL
jgi:predicted Zn-dependent protease